MSKTGTTLIEVLLYLLLSMMILTGTSQLILSTYSSVQNHIKRADSLIQLSCALSYFARDIKKANREGFRVVDLRKDRCIYHVEGKDYGWLLKKGRFMRYAGHYNSTTNKWHNVSVSMLASSVQAIVFTYTYTSGAVTGIACELTSDSSHLSVFIALGAL